MMHIAHIYVKRDVILRVNAHRKISLIYLVLACFFEYVCVCVCLHCFAPSTCGEWREQISAVLHTLTHTFVQLTFNGLGKQLNELYFTIHVQIVYPILYVV